MSSHADSMLIDEIVPRLRTMIPRQVSFVGSEDAEEVLQDATLMAARMLARARANGKTVTPGNIAYYTMLHVRSGRRSHSPYWRGLSFELERPPAGRFVRTNSQDHAADFAGKTDAPAKRRYPGLYAELQ